MEFIKSSFSEGRDPRCVEVKFETERVLIRNSRKKKFVLEFTSGEWEAFIQGVKNGEFDMERV